MQVKAKIELDVPLHLRECGKTLQAYAYQFHSNAGTVIRSCAKTMQLKSNYLMFLCRGNICFRSCISVLVEFPLNADEPER